LDAEFCQVAHPTDKSDKTIRVFRDDAQILFLSCIDLACTPIENHARVTANRRQRSSQFVCNVCLQMRPHLKHRLERILLLENPSEVVIYF